jgi:hypothetical protein
MKNRRRLSALILTALFLAAAITSFFVIAHEADHVCIGEDCAVCALVAVCQNTIRVLGNALAVAVCIAMFGCFILSFGSLSLKTKDRKTPVSLKVKLSN